MIHYDYGGNSYYQIPSVGFCGAKSGDFTIARRDVTCADCCKVVADLDAWSAPRPAAASGSAA